MTLGTTRGTNRVHDAFTLLELLVVITVIAILASLIFPVFGRAKRHAQGIACMDNGKQMSLALQMYANEYNGWFPPNPDWATNEMWVRGEMEKPKDATNTLLLSGSKLMPYMGNAIRIFKCPGDSSAHVRSYSMSQAVGTKPGSPAAAVDGPWLNGTHHHVASSPWRTYGNFSDMVNPDPSKLWVLMDENQYNINDAAFAVSMTSPTEMIDWPGTHHGYAAGVSFADGHSEIHKWTEKGTGVAQTVYPVNKDNTTMPWKVSMRNSADYEWVQDGMPYK